MGTHRLAGGGRRQRHLVGGVVGGGGVGGDPHQSGDSPKSPVAQVTCVEIPHAGAVWARPLLIDRVNF